MIDLIKWSLLWCCTITIRDLVVSIQDSYNNVDHIVYSSVKFIGADAMKSALQSKIFNFEKDSLA